MARLLRLGSALVTTAAFHMPLATTIWAHESPVTSAVAAPSAAAKEDVSAAVTAWAKEAPDDVKDLKAIEDKMLKVVDHLKACTVGITIPNMGSGSGVLVSEDGYVLTAGHVSNARQKAGADLIIIMPDGKEYKAVSLGSNNSHDSGMCKIIEENVKFPFVELSDIDAKIGEWVIKLGHPSGYIAGRPPCVRLGRVLNMDDYEAQYDCPGLGGDSGGPAFNLDGKLIGLHSGGYGAFTQEYCNPIASYRKEWDRLKAGEIWGAGKTQPKDDNRLGIRCHRMNLDCQVVQVLPESPAQKGGMKAGDIIVEVNGLPVASFADLVYRMTDKKVGDEVELVVKRGEENVPLKVTLAEFAPERICMQSERVRSAFRDAVEEASKSTVRVKCDGDGAALGCIVDPNGFIITKASLLKGKVTCLLNDGQELDATIVGVQEPYDLAMLKVDAKDLPAAQWADKEPLVGQFIAAPGEDVAPVAIGIVSVQDRPLIRQATQMGVQLQDQDNGLRVGGVTAGGAAAAAGLKADDVITHFKGKKVKDREALTKAVRACEVGEKVKMDILRDKQKETLEITLTGGLDPAAAARDYQLDMQQDQFMGGPRSEKRRGFPRAIQHDAILTPENCGGPLVNLEGKVVGINLSRSGFTESFAASTDVVRSLLADLMSGKLAPKKK